MMSKLKCVELFRPEDVHPEPFGSIIDPVHLCPFKFEVSGPTTFLPSSSMFWSPLSFKKSAFKTNPCNPAAVDLNGVIL